MAQIGSKKRLSTRGALVIMVRYLRQAEDGTYYFHRKIRKPLREHYGGRELLRWTLSTKDLKEAAKLADQFAREQDALWKAILSGQQGLTSAEVREAAKSLIKRYKPQPETETHPNYPGEVRTWSAEAVLDGKMEDWGDPLHRTAIQEEAARLLRGEKTTPLFSEALDVYLKEHKNSGRKKFNNDTRLAIGLVTRELGNRPMDQYTRREVAEWRDRLLETTTTGTFKRRLASITVREY